MVIQLCLVLYLKSQTLRIKTGLLIGCGENGKLCQKESTTLKLWMLLLSGTSDWRTEDLAKQQKNTPQSKTFCCCRSSLSIFVAKHQYFANSCPSTSCSAFHIFSPTSSLSKRRICPSLKWASTRNQCSLWPRLQETRITSCLALIRGVSLAKALELAFGQVLSQMTPTQTLLPLHP